MALESLAARGFEIAFVSHAYPNLSADFLTALAEFESALAGTAVPIDEIREPSSK
jgi:hypothetical protein